MSRTVKHPPKPDRFTRRYRIGARQARAKKEKAMRRTEAVEIAEPR